MKHAGGFRYAIVSFTPTTIEMPRAKSAGAVSIFAREKTVHGSDAHTMSKCPGLYRDAMISRQLRTSPQMCVCPLTRGHTHGFTSTDTFSNRYLMVAMYCRSATISVQLPLQRSNTHSLCPRGK